MFRGNRRRWSGRAFPLLADRAPIGGNAASAHRFLLRALLALSVLVPGAAMADIAAQIDTAIEHHLDEQLRDEAERQGWSDMTFEHSVRLPRIPANVNTCAGAVSVRALHAEQPQAPRQRFQVRCSDQDWSLSVAVQVNVFVPVVHAITDIERGQRLRAADLALERANIGALRRGFFHEVADVTEFVATRRIRANQPLTPALAERPPAVQRGQRVTLVASRDGISATTYGEALADGAIGDVIRVRNLSSDKIVHAEVVEPGVLTTTFD